LLEKALPPVISLLLLIEYIPLNGHREQQQAPRQLLLCPMG
jgi:hypothetical protein